MTAKDLTQATHPLRRRRASARKGTGGSITSASAKGSGTVNGAEEAQAREIGTETGSGASVAPAPPTASVSRPLPPSSPPPSADVTATANPVGTEIVIETVANATKTGTSAGIATSLLHAARAQALTVTPGVTLSLPLRHLPRLQMADHK